MEDAGDLVLDIANPLDPFIVAMLASGDAPPLDRDKVQQAREEARNRERPIDQTAPRLARVFDRVADGINVRCYVPNGPGPMPMVLFIHGGGFVLGDLDTHDGMCRYLAAGTGAVVVAVDYRLAPEHAFPAAIDDCVAVRSWMADHAHDLDGDPERVALVGDSAGGTLAVGVALRTAAQPAKALGLLYPVTDYPDERRESYRDFATGFGLTRDMMGTFWDLYAPDRPDEAAPLRYARFNLLPPTLILTASHDILRDEGEAFAQRATLAGINTRLIRVEGVNHGFLHLVGAVPSAGKAMAKVTEWLGEALSGVDEKAGS